MVDQEECISTFFQNASKANRVIPKEDALDSSQDSQNSTEDADMLSLSQLTIQEQEPLSIQPFFNITPRKMPFSPHYIFEEEFSSNPWAMIIATIFLTKTAGKIARPYMKGFFELYPSPYHVLDCNPVKLESFFENLGLKKRAYMIWKLSYQFVSAGWQRASDLCGIGKYGEDAYRIFCLGHSDLDPGDRYLKLYLDWLRGQTEFLEENGVIDSEFVIEEPELKYYRLTLRDHVR